MHGVFSISPLEQQYFFKTYGDRCTYIPAFHDTERHTELVSSEKQLLYHGNLSVSENVGAALFLIKVYQNTPNRLVIASSYSNNEVETEIEKYANIHFHPLQASEDLYPLFETSHINVLPTFQNTGIKLKLLNTLYQGKFIIANDYMVKDTGLESLCERANTKKEFLEKTKLLFKKEFTKSIIEEREETMKELHPIAGAQKMIEIIFN